MLSYEPITCIATLKVAGTQNAAVIRYYQFLVMPPKDVLIMDSFESCDAEKGVEAREGSSDCLVLLQKVLIQPLLQIVHEQNSIHPSFTSLYQFEQGGISGNRLIHGVCLDPDVVLTLIDHFPHSLKELVPFVMHYAYLGLLSIGCLGRAPFSSSSLEVIC